MIKKRVPFIKDDSGNFIGFDFNPGKEGVIGQIINYGRDDYNMYVFAYTFKDFIDCTQKYDYKKDFFLTDYLIENKISSINNKKIDSSIRELLNISTESNIKQEITTPVIHEETKTINFTDNYLTEIIKLLQQMNDDILYNKNVTKYKNYWFDYRIINKRDSLSRTMSDEKNFYMKLDSYNKDEIKGFSFAITNYIEELINGKLLMGEEKIFVQINILKNEALIRYTETIGNENMKNAYNKIKEY